jgi:hypothetical protein
VAGEAGSGAGSRGSGSGAAGDVTAEAVRASPGGPAPSAGAARAFQRGVV